MLKNVNIRTAYMPKSIRGYFTDSIDGYGGATIVINDQLTPEDAIATVVHELVHAWIQDNTSVSSDILEVMCRTSLSKIAARLNAEATE